MDWYIPITILPAIGLLILSTTAQMMGLSNEIGSLLSEKCSPFEYKISGLKIKQLKRLTIATSLFYVSAACFVLSGILGAVLQKDIWLSQKVPNFVLLIGVILILFALVLLIIYGIKATSIREKQHEFNRHLNEE